MLTEIYSILTKHNTNYKIVLGPIYNSEKLNPDDMTVLRNIFGESKIYDFSGANKYSTDIRNYYEPSHYTIATGKKILNEIYTHSSGQ